MNLNTSKIKKKFYNAYLIHRNNFKLLLDKRFFKNALNTQNNSLLQFRNKSMKKQFKCVKYSR